MEEISPFQILHNPLLNKETAFEKKERDLLHLHGFLPEHISSLQEQINRIFLSLKKKNTALEKYIFLNELMNRNELLFYQFLQEHIQEMLPLIYTPTVGEAALQYSLICQKPRGLYLSYPLQDKIEEILEHYSTKEIEVIVVTDGERILGLGDQGVGGMVIPVGKLILYTLFAGIHPEKTLPILLDVGTNNEFLLGNEFYLGYRSRRIIGKEYEGFIEHFIDCIRKKFPKALVQWEDFGKANAKKILKRYQKRVLSFNDDIQGTASTALGGILSALQVRKESLLDQKIVIFGGGSAGLGIAEGILQMMLHLGLSKKEALSRFFILDKQGLIHSGQEGLCREHTFFAQRKEELQQWKVKQFLTISLQEVLENLQAPILIGASAQAGAFNENCIKALYKTCKRPIIFPLSNPPSKMEAFPEELLSWTEGNAILATGSPFEPISYKGRFYKIGQCNNLYTFPGVGLGALAVEAKEVTDTMFLKAAEVLSTFSPMIKDSQAPLYPEAANLSKVAFAIACEVAKQAVREKVATKEGSIEELVQKRIWKASY